jgi:hypothetical protein
MPCTGYLPEFWFLNFEQNVRDLDTLKVSIINIASITGISQVGNVQAYITG